MKPEQFIREFGAEKAREILNDTPAQSYFTCFCSKCGWGGSSQKLNVNGYDRDWIACPECYSEKIETEDAAINELKRLVESLDLIKAYGGIESCKQILYMLHELTEDPEPIREAVRDHESIYGGGE
ncbi:TPA: hypothetical protein LUJ97_001665 [Acinetobacter nosocomialis]|nr:hypothetical protein [Acinetobacter nosocomialis]